MKVKDFMITDVIVAKKENTIKDVMMCFSGRYYGKSFVCLV